MSMRWTHSLHDCQAKLFPSPDNTDGMRGLHRSPASCSCTAAQHPHVRTRLSLIQGAEEGGHTLPGPAGMIMLLRMLTLRWAAVRPALRKRAQHGGTRRGLEDKARAPSRQLPQEVWGVHTRTCYER